MIKNPRDALVRVTKEACMIESSSGFRYDPRPTNKFNEAIENMVVIRLSRSGGIKNPFYHLVVADQRKSRDGRYIERIGYYNPNARGQDIRLQLGKERFDYWISKGAIASERVAHLVKQFAKDPDAAQKAGPTISELKRAQVIASMKAEKAAVNAAKEAAAETPAQPESSDEEQK